MVLITRLQRLIDRNYRRRISYLLISMPLLSMLFLSSIALAASDSWPDCTFACRTDEVTVQDVWLGDANGNRLSSCTPESPMTAYIWATIRNDADGSRRGLILLTDIYVNNNLVYSTYPQGICLFDLMPKETTSSIPLYSFSFNCDDEVKLSRSILSWETTSSITCNNANRKCNKRDNKCYGGSATEIIVVGPPKCLINGPDFLCDYNTATYEAAINEISSYTYIYTWSVDGTTQGKEKSFLLEGSSFPPGNHTIKLSVEAAQSSQAVYLSECELQLLIIQSPRTDITVS